MPKLPGGMFKRGKRFYFRDRINYRDRWISLGPDYAVACRKLQEMKASVSFGRDRHLVKMNSK